LVASSSEFCARQVKENKTSRNFDRTIDDLKIPQFSKKFLLLGPGTGDYCSDDSSRETGHQKNVKSQHNPTERGTLHR
jgi:hypothetical protein